MMGYDLLLFSCFPASRLNHSAISIDIQRVQREYREMAEREQKWPIQEKHQH